MVDWNRLIYEKRFSTADPLVVEDLNFKSSSRRVASIRGVAMRTATCLVVENCSSS